MASSGGLSRRRVGGGGASTSSSTYNDADDDDNNNTMSRRGSSITNNGQGGLGNGGHAGSAFEGGSKIAFDPRDLQQDAGEEARIGGKMPRLTIMEEVLLLGIKDKQVSAQLVFGLFTV